MTTEELKEIIRKHGLWINEAGGERADLQGANLQGAYLQGANLRGAYLQGAKLPPGYASYLPPGWRVTITPELVIIGCQAHSLESWQNFSDEEISEMHDDALEWWHENKEEVIKFAIETREHKKGLN